MPVGQILLQPQKLQRARQRTPEFALLDDLVAFVILVAADGAEGGPLPGRLAQAAEDAVVRMAEKAAAGATSAAAHLSALFQPTLTSLQGALQSAPDEPGAAADLFVQALASAVEGLNTLTAAQLRGSLQQVFDVVEQDLGFTPDFVEQSIWDLFDRMAAALEQPSLSETLGQRARRRETAAILLRLKRDAQPAFRFPRLNADRASQALVAILRDPDVHSALGKAACVSKGAATAFHLGRSVTDLVADSESNLSRGLLPMRFAAAADAPLAGKHPVQVGYYATKLLNTQNWDGDWGSLPSTMEEKLTDGYVLPELRDAFRPLSIVLSRYSFLLTKKENEEWNITDRKQYIIKKEASKLIVFPLVELNSSDFVSAVAAHGDFSELRRMFKENGILLSSDLTVTNTDGSNSWDIQEGSSGHRYQAVTFSGTITLYPLNRLGILFEIPADLASDLTQKLVSPALVRAFNDNGIPLSPRTRLSQREGGNAWNLDDGEFAFHIQKDGGKLLVDTGGFFGWLFSTLSWPPYSEKVWLNSERTQVLLGHRILHTGDAVTWQDAPKFKVQEDSPYYSFAKVPPESIEKWAYVTSWVQDLLNASVYGAQIGIAAAEGKVHYSVTSTSFNVARSIADMSAKLAKDRSVSDLIGIDSQTWLFDWGWWFDFLVYLGIKVAGGVEAIASPSTPDTSGANDFSKFVDKVLSALLETKAVDTYWVGLAYEAILSFLTLYNHEEPKDPKDPKVKRPDNYKENGGFVDPFWNIGLLIYCAALPDDEYALPFQTVNLTAYHWLLGMLGLGAVSGFLGWILAQVVVAGAGFGADNKQLAKTLAKSWLKSTGYFFPFLKLVKGKNN